MSVAGLLRVKDELDVIEISVRHLATQVDWIYAADNLSTDGTRELLHDLESELPLTVTHDDVFAHEQGRVMSELAARAFGMGHDWLLPASADEIWFAHAPIRNLLAAQPPKIEHVHGVLYHHILTSEDPDDPNPLVRMGWRQVDPMSGTFGRFCCRARWNLEFAPGCHATNYPAQAGRENGGIEIRHYGIRSPEQFLRKAANGLAVYEATSLGPEHGVHWRQWGSILRDEGEEAAMDFFYSQFFSADPASDPSLVYDPVLVAA